VRDLNWLRSHRAQLTPQQTHADLEFLRTLPGIPLRVHIARSFALEPILPFVELFLRLAGWDPSVKLGEFNQWRQELQTVEADVLWMALRLEDLVPGLRERPVRTEAEIESTADEVIAQLALPPNALMNRFVSSTPQLVPVAERVNRRLAVNWVALDEVCARIGWRQAFDYRFEAMAAIPYARPVLFALAREFAATLLRQGGRRIKCIVCDCDHTLWGGVVGELGTDIVLGDSYPGSAYKDFQRVLLGFYHQGVLLAINSRNNPEDVLEVLDRHPHQLLRREHFACIEVHWGDKAEALTRIAEELNVGLDTLLFIDDDPLQCARVASAHPNVLVVQQPSSPLDVPFSLTGVDELRGGPLTGEDLQRTQMVLQNQQRAAISLDEFYADLDTELELWWDNPKQLERAVQLAQKTNQFKLTAELPKGQQVVTGALRDRFGELGVIGVALISGDQRCARLDNILFSCRALGRGVEKTFLSHLLAQLQSRGVEAVLARWEQLPRNAQTEDFLEQCGFQPTAEERNYRFEFGRDSLPLAATWINVRTHSADER
jgi:FkbH-like protein